MPTKHAGLSMPILIASLLMWLLPSQGLAECLLVFEADLIRDTILPSERLYVRLSLSNQGDSSVFYRPICFARTFVDIHLLREEDGWEGDYSGGTAEWIIDTTARDKLHPGESIQVFDVVSQLLLFEMEVVCDSPRRGWTRWQTGTYVAELRYTYDLWERNTCADLPYLPDTVRFVVAEERPEDTRAFEAFLNAYCMPADKWTDAFWHFMEEYPKSRYRALAVRIMSGRLGFDRPKDVRVADLVREIAHADPYDYEVGHAVNRLLARSGRCARTEIVHELLDSLPSPCPVRTILEREID